MTGRKIRCPVYGHGPIDAQRRPCLSCGMRCACRRHRPSCKPGSRSSPLAGSTLLPCPPISLCGRPCTPKDFFMGVPTWSRRQSPRAPYTSRVSGCVLSYRASPSAPRLQRSAKKKLKTDSRQRGSQKVDPLRTTLNAEVEDYSLTESEREGR